MGIYKIAEHGESNFHIVAHQYSDETIRFAASEMQKYLLMATNAAIPYFSDDPRCPMRGPEIRIGAEVRGETKVEEDLHDDGFCIRGVGEHITITGKTSRGVLYGVYRFLEIFCNYRCFTKDAETIDQIDVLEIELDEIKEEPSFDFRDAYFRNAFDGAFASKNHLNSSLCDISVARGGRMKWFNFHHSFNDLVPEKIYFDEHPEYYSEIDGERKRATQLCLTNPDVLKIAEKTLRSWIENNPECKVFSVAQNDSMESCTCPNCMAIEKEEGSPSGPIIHFVNKLADAIRDDYPDVLLHTFAYQHTLKAPKKVVARDNVIVRLCSVFCRFEKPFYELAPLKPGGEEELFVNSLKEWQHHAKQLYVWDYAVNFRNYLQPFVNFHNLAKNIKFFKEHGVRGVLEQGNFAYGGGACFDDMKSYIISKLLWNHNTDIDDEIHRFCMGVYGESAGPLMEEYTRLIEEACASSELYIYQYPDVPAITDELVAKADELVSKAISVADTGEYRKRIEREYLSVRFLKLSRLEMDAPNRTEKINELFDDIKRFGITEIRERKSLAVLKELMLKNRYVKDRTNEYLLYYIMK